MVAGLAPSKGASAAADSVSAGLMTEVMKFMRRSCLGQHKKMQDVLRVQRVNRQSYNFYQEAVQYMTILEPDLKAAIQSGEQGTSLCEATIRGFQMLSDAMKGPNFENQQAIATSGILDLTDRIMNKIKLDPGKDRGALLAVPKTIGKLGKVVPVLDDDDDGIVAPAVSVMKQNETRCRLKSSMVDVLWSFLEGGTNGPIPMQMLSTCNWVGYASQINDCYHMRDRCRRCVCARVVMIACCC